MKLWSQEYLDQVLVKGENEEKREIAKRIIMDDSNITNEKLSYYTGLPIDEIQKLKSKLENN